MRTLARVARWYEAIRAEPAFAPTYYPGSLASASPICASG